MLHTDLIAPIPELLRRHATARGGKCAYRDARSSVTYAELLDRTGRLAGHLADLGIAPNDTVAIMLPNSVAWVESCFAIARAGAGFNEHQCARDDHSIAAHRLDHGQPIATRSGRGNTELIPPPPAATPFAV